MLHSKKAVSPLIAAVLLIVVVVGIGSVVVGIVRNLVTENQATMSERDDMITCSRDVVIDVLQVNEDLQICKGSNYVYAIVENTGGVDIQDFQLVIFATSGMYLNDSISASNVFTKGEIQEFNGTFSGISASDIEQIKLIPKLKGTSGQQEYNVCFDVAIKYEDVVDCPL